MCTTSARDNARAACLAGLLLVLAAGQAQATKYSVCEGAKSMADVSEVKISGCEDIQETCPFLRGFNKSIEVDFVPKQKMETVKIKVTGKLNSLPVPFHIHPDNACGNYGFDCPLEAGKAYKLKMAMPILRSYPKINVDIFLRMVNEEGNLISCVEMPARIQEPQKD